MWQTPFCDEYGLEAPFIGAGMGFISMPELTAAVSNAGGLGILGASPLPAPAVAELFPEIRKLTDRPFGIDLIVEETPLGALTTEAHIELCEAERPAVVVFFWNLPPVAWVERLQSAGCKVWMTTGSLSGALAARDAGFDAIIAQGAEAGGHVKAKAGLIALLPAICDAVAPLPVIAAGAISDARGVAATMLLGAQGVCVGTRLLSANEANIHPEYADRVIEASLDNVKVTRVFGPEWPDQPMNVIANRAVQRAAVGHEPGPEAGPIGETTLMGQPYKMPPASAVLATRETSGDFEQMCLAAGQGVSLVRKRQETADIIREMMDGARKLVPRIAGLTSA